MCEDTAQLFQTVVDFIRQVFRKPDGPVALHAPVFMGNEKKYLLECIDTTFVSSVGKFVDRFEDMVAAYTGAARAVACVNGTSALQLALQLAGVKPGDEVITQSLTFVATANAIAHNGASPVLLDVDRHTLGLSAAAMEDWLHDNAIVRGPECLNTRTHRRISACVPMHTFGHPADLERIISICEEYRLPLVEDAAESLGSFYKKRHTGTFGKVGVLSFNGNKTITTGGGGMLLFQDVDLASRAKHLTTQARVPHPWEFYHDEIGYNYRMPNLNAALGCAQMEQLGFFLRKKRALAQSYETFFARTRLAFLTTPADCESNYWLNLLLLRDLQERDDFLRFTNDRGVQTRPIWHGMDRLPMFASCQRGPLDCAKWYEDRAVNIPSSVCPVLA